MASFGQLFSAGMPLSMTAHSNHRSDSAQTAHKIFAVAGKEEGRSIVGGNAIEMWPCRSGPIKDREEIAEREGEPGKPE